MELVRTGLACLVALVTATAPSAQRRVNAPLAPGIVGDVAWHEISPDGARVVYTADQEINAHVELYSVPSAGGPAVKLNIPRPGLIGNAISFEVTSDSTRVVFLHSEDLYVVPIAGGPALQLNAEEGAGSRASRFQVSADLQRVVYWSLYEDFHGLFSVPIGGGPIVTIEARKVSGFEISPDATRIVFERLSNGHLYSAPIGGGTVTQLTSALHGRIARFEISPDSSRVVYVGYGDTNGVDELYSVPIAGGAVVKLNPPLPAGGDVGNQSAQRDFLVSPSSTHVVYFADQVTDGPMELFSVPIAGGASVRLNGNLIAGTGVSAALLTASGPVRVVYTAVQETAGLRDLYSVPITGGTAIKLSGPQASPEGVHSGVDGVELAPNGTRALYVTRPPLSVQRHLFSVPITGGTATRIDGVTSPELTVQNGLISADSQTVVYRASYSSGELRQDSLWSVPITGGAAHRLDAPLASWTFAWPFSISPTSNRVVFQSDQDFSDVTELFSVSISGGENVQLNPPLAPSGIAGDVSGFAVSADGHRAIYRADQDEDEVHELYASRVVSGIPHKVNAPLTRGGDVTAIGLSEDGQRTLYVADQDEHGTFELYACNTDDPAPIKISAPLVANGDVTHFQLAPAGLRVVYRADRFSDEHFELFSTDGSTTADLNMDLSAGQRVSEDFAISDEGRAVYRVLGPAGDELYSANIAGGAFTRLNGPLATLGDVKNFWLTPGGGRVLYLADEERNNVHELHSVPVQGGTAVRISGPMIDDGDVFERFELTTDGAWVVYLADQEVDEVYELYRASTTDGVPAKLNGPLGTGEDVDFDFRVSPDGARTVFAVSHPQNGHVLYSMPTLGGPAVQLASSSSTRFYPVEISPDSLFVVYQGPTGVLSSVPIGGGTPVFLGASGRFWITPDSSAVLFQGPDGGESALLRISITGGAATRIAGPLGSRFEELRIAGDRVLYLNSDDDDLVELYSLSLTRKSSLAPWPAPPGF